MKLYFGPGACSIGIHYLLEQIGAPYERQRVDLKSGENNQDWYAELNPKKKVPTLQLNNGSVLTEFPVIARYLADENPAAKLVPQDKETLLRASELCDFVVATIHMQGFSRAFRPVKFAPDESQHKAVIERGREIIRDGFNVVEKVIAPGGTLASVASFADAALFYTFFWGAERLKLSLPTTCAAKWQQLKSSEAGMNAFRHEAIAI
jgi:glutathione S-transferase